MFKGVNERWFLLLSLNEHIINEIQSKKIKKKIKKKTKKKQL